MFFKKSLVYIAIFVPLFLSSQPSFATDINEFLKRKAVKVESSEVFDSINKFLNYQTLKKSFVWFKGSIVTTKDVTYTDLEVNFNVLDNSLYLLNNGSVYRVSNFALKGFDIVQDGEKMVFRKGFAIASWAKIEASFDGSVNDLLQYLTSYPNFSELQIDDISVSENNETKLSIRLITGFREQVTELKRFIDANENVVSSDTEHAVSELEPTKYLQVLYAHEKFTVLKYHFKRNATAETISVVKHSSAFMFDDEDYFIADARKNLQEFLFTKKSIEKVLSSIEVASTKKVKNVGNESSAIAWFKSSTFN